MNRVLAMIGTTVAAGALAAVPAVVGLSGNPQFSHQIPVRAPSQVTQRVDAVGTPTPSEHSGPARDTGAAAVTAPASPSGPSAAPRSGSSSDDTGRRGRASDDSRSHDAAPSTADDRGRGSSHAAGTSSSSRPPEDRAASSADDAGGHRGSGRSGGSGGGHGADG